MSVTAFGVNDPQEVKKWGTAMAVAVNRKSYFTSKMASEGKEATKPIQIVTDLEKDAGMEVTVDLLMPMSMEPVVQAKLEGKGQALKYFTDKLRIEEVRGAVSKGNRVTSKKTLRNLREDAKRVMKDWWARLQDELVFLYLSGGFGVNAGFVWSSGNPMFSVNAFTAPDTNHILYGGNATQKSDVGTDDGFDLRLIDRAVAKAETMGGDGTDELSMVPITVDGSDANYVVLMHTFQFDAMKSSTSTGQWLDIQKAAAGATGNSSPLFKNSGGMYADTVIHKHRNVIRYGDYGGGTVPAARALFLAAQAASIAYGSTGGGMGTRYRWTEVVTDHDSHVEIGSHCMLGVKKSTYTNKSGSVSRDFGVFALDTYCKDPNS